MQKAEYGMRSAEDRMRKTEYSSSRQIRDILTRGRVKAVVALLG